MFYQEESGNPAAPRKSDVKINGKLKDPGFTPNTKLLFENGEQGCQIFLGATYQNGEKYTKGP
jgi:hypothetical protein